MLKFIRSLLSLAHPLTSSVEVPAYSQTKSHIRSRSKVVFSNPLPVILDVFLCSDFKQLHEKFSP